MAGQEHVWLSSLLTNHQNLQSSNDSLSKQLKAEQLARAAVEAQNLKLSADACKAESARKKAIAAAAEAKKKARSAASKAQAAAEAAIKTTQPPQPAAAASVAASSSGKPPVAKAYTDLMSSVCQQHRQLENRLKTLYPRTSPAPPPPPAPPPASLPPITVVVGFTPTNGKYCQYTFGGHTYLVIPGYREAFCTTAAAEPIRQE